MSPKFRRRIERWIGAALFAWPRAARREYAGEILRVVLADADERHASGRLSLRWLVGECLRVVSGGLGLRAKDVAASLPGLSGGWRADVLRSGRSLLRARGFSTVAIVLVAGGVGVNAAIVSLARDLLGSPSYIEAPGELVGVWGVRPNGERARVPADIAAGWARSARTVRSVGFLHRVTDGVLEAPDGGGVDHVRVGHVTPELMLILGVDGTSASAPPESQVWLSHSLWADGYASAPDVVGSFVRVDGERVRVVGVAPAGFRIPLPPDAGVSGEADLWAAIPDPLERLVREDGRLADQDSDDRGVVVARLSRGAEVADVQREVDRLWPDVVAGTGRSLVDAPSVAPLISGATAHIRPLLFGIGLGAFALLTVSLLNLSGLWLARGARRRDELALRVALGATKTQLTRLLLIEAGVLGLLAGVAALSAGWALAAVLTARAPGLLGVAIHEPAALPAVPVVLAGFVATVVAALPSIGERVLGRADVASTARSAGTSRTRRVFVAVQVGCSAALVVLAGFLLHSAHELGRVDPGFRPAGVLAFSASLRAPDRFGGPGDRARLMRRVEDELSTLPGVVSVGIVGALPLSGRRWEQPWGAAGEPPSAWTEMADFRVTTSGYFGALGIDLVEGRTFSREEDLTEARRVVVLDETMARRLRATAGWTDEGVVGRSIGLPLDGAAVVAEVVGVVRTVRHDNLRLKARGAIYVPYRQEASRDVDVVVYASHDTERLADEVRSAVQAVDDHIPVYSVRTMESWIAEQVTPTRVTFAFLAGFAALTLLACAIGLYGVVAYEVTRRRREIGLRVAIGAPVATVVQGFVRDGLTVGMPGAAAGWVGAAGILASPIARQLGLDLYRPIVWAGAVTLTVAIIVVATWLPTRRLGRLDPSSALRAE
ncbi:MAG: FtsX-like permease family protein [Gemmatimonadota bacterium]